jgi:hypothetical protein
MLGSLAGCAGRETLRVSFDHSEWHEPSLLVLDVPTGGFSALFRDGSHAAGSFSRSEMREIKSLLHAAKESGFANDDCLRTPPRERRFIVVSNGGRQRLDYRVKETKLDAPADLTCWTTQATALHDFINSLLYRRGNAWTMPRQRRESSQRGQLHFSDPNEITAVS